MQPAKNDAHAEARELYEQRQIEKIEQVLLRQAERAQRTDEQQLARLDKAFGEGQGAQRERARLAKRIADAKVKSPSKKKKGR